MSATYILPVRLSDTSAVHELAIYLRGLRQFEIIVVDGSPPAIFDEFHRHIGDFATHVQPRFPGANGKARGVLTGLALASNEKIVVADDDVRYDERSLAKMLQLLDDAEVVRPQNYFSPAPWHAIWDSARSLVNRMLDGDWPGTLGFRKSALPNGYNADVLFENFELVRTIRSRGGRELVARELFVRREPPMLRHFIGQRVRQAYDEFARPERLVVGLAIVPVVAIGWRSAGALSLFAFVAVTVLVAAAGWLRGDARHYFSPLAVVAAPCWAAERGICCWVALFQRVAFGGVRYGGTVILAAASRPNDVNKWVS